MENFVYFFISNYSKLITRLYFGKVEVRGIERIPKEHPVIYSVNHQNAFMDALIVGSLSPKITYSITRADVFKPLFKWFMDAIKMIPIYRIRDGYDQLAKNEETFKKINEALNDSSAVTIFSEGNHGNDYYLRSISKGSARMALEAQTKMKQLDVMIVPVGINYYHHQRPLHKVSVVYGNAISVKLYFDLYLEHGAKGVNQLKEAIAEGMKSCLLIPENNLTYDDQIKKINRLNESLSFHEMKEQLTTQEALHTMSKPNRSIYFLGKVLGIFNFGPLLLLQIILGGIKDIVFYGSIKWATALIIFPIWYFLIWVTSSYLLGAQWGFAITLSGVSLLYLRQYLIKWSNVQH
jgi:1-acyl-sn-glycerol-3-phosphate acyltransferase